MSPLFDTPSGRPQPSPSPEKYWLPMIGWQIFGHPTFAEEAISESRSVSRFFCLVRRASKLSGRPWRKVLWFLKRERGTLNDHQHFHFCMGGLGESADLTFICHALEEEWENKGGGICRIEPYRQDLHGVFYNLKKRRRSSSPFPVSSKFIWDHNEVMISDSVWPHLRRRFPAV